ncbi:MAG: hypothetical protein WBC21_04510 [Minisyncoccales bacterium]
MISKKYFNQKGQIALLVTLVILGAILSIGAGLTLVTIKEMRMAKNIEESAKAITAADAGTEEALYIEKTVGLNPGDTGFAILGDTSYDWEVQEEEGWRFLKSIGTCHNIKRAIKTNLSFLAAMGAGGGWSVYHSCASTDKGTVYCWGMNVQGQLGDGTTIGRTTPVQVKGVGGVGDLDNIFAVSTGGGQTCALKNDGTVYCWGKNDHGQLGDDTIIDSTTPVQVKGVGGVGNLDNISVVSGGGTFTCALKNDGTVYCWGCNSQGQLGDDTIIDSTTPVQVKGVGGVGNLTNISAVSGGGAHSCALKNDGTVYCWGSNSCLWPFFCAGVLGDNSIVAHSTTPVQVKGVGGVGNLTNISAIGAQWANTCALKNDGTVYCWGDNDSGQLGDGTTTHRRVPVQVKGVGGVGNLTNISAVSTASSGGDYNCALKNDGTVYCWGMNDYWWGIPCGGQLGDGTITDSTTPVQVKGVGGVGNLTNISAVSTGFIHSCALESNGRAYCWGCNNGGQIGDGTSGNTRTTPVCVKGTGARLEQKEIRP